jgi:hypothetical protein
MITTTKIMHAIVDQATGKPLAIYDFAHEAVLALPAPGSSRIAKDLTIEPALVTIEPLPATSSLYMDGVFLGTLTDFQLPLNLVPA